MPFHYIDTFIASLNESEKKTIQHHYIPKNSSEDLLKSKYLQNSINTNASESKGLSVNRMLKSRAFEDMSDILISNYHINNKANFASQDQILLRLKKKVLLARVISKSLNQNKIAPFKTFLNTIISEAEKNEVYEVLIEALNLKMSNFFINFLEFTCPFF